MDKELLELVFDNVENGIYVVDGQGVTVGVNRTFEEMSGFSNAELTGRSLYDMVGRLIVTSVEETITWEDAAPTTGQSDDQSKLSLKEMLLEQEQKILLQALRQHGTTRRVAEALGISQASAARKLKEIRARQRDAAGLGNAREIV
jgi:transcriptional regulator with PAS, ATPase and Fis domain